MAGAVLGGVACTAVSRDTAETSAPRRSHYAQRPPTYLIRLISLVTSRQSRVISQVSHPDDVIKTRMQTHLRGSPMHDCYASYTATGLHILRTEGLGALFHGAAFRCLLRVPAGLSVIIVFSSALRERIARRTATGAAAVGAE